MVAFVTDDDQDDKSDDRQDQKPDSGHAVSGVAQVDHQRGFLNAASAPLPAAEICRASYQQQAKGADDRQHQINIHANIGIIDKAKEVAEEAGNRQGETDGGDHDPEESQGGAPHGLGNIANRTGGIVRAVSFSPLCAAVAIIFHTGSPWLILLLGISLSIGQTTY